MKAKLALVILATAVLAVPFAARADGGDDLHLQPNPWKRSSTIANEAKRNTLSSARLERPLINAFEGSMRAQ